MWSAAATAEHRGPVRLRLDRSVRAARSDPCTASAPATCAAKRRPPSFTTAAQVPPDRRREDTDGHPHHRSRPVPTRWARRQSAAHPPRPQPAHPGVHRFTACSRARATEGIEHCGAVGLASGHRRCRPRRAEGTDLTYLHGVAAMHTAPVPEDLDVIEVPAGTWAVFRAEGEYPRRFSPPGLRRRPTGSRRTRGGSVRALRSSRSSIARPTSVWPPPSFGCRSRAPGRAGIASPWTAMCPSGDRRAHVNLIAATLPRRARRSGLIPLARVHAAAVVHPPGVDGGGFVAGQILHPERLLVIVTDPRRP